MKKQLLRFTLYALMVYLTGSTLNLAVAASQPSGGNGTHFFGVIDGQLNKGDADQYPNRHYARTFAANLNVGEPYTVRLIYFLPNDRQPQPDIDTKMDALIKDAQQFYADMMEKHGFGRKTFRFETDATGKTVVHHVNGKFNDAYYRNADRVVWEEINEQFDMSKNIYLCALDTGARFLGVHDGGEVYGRGGGGSFGGTVTIAAHSGRFDVVLTVHELGHAFGLTHDDYRVNGKWISTLSVDPMVTSFCAAEWLDVHRYFNANQYSQDVFNTTVQMFPPSLASPPNSIRLRFEVSDTDGLHQVQLHTPEIKLDIKGGFFQKGGFLACKRLTGTSSIVEFVTTLALQTEAVFLQMIDVHGNLSWSEQFPIDITPLLPPSKVVSIPDANLASAIQHEIGWPITTHTMLNLDTLDIPNRQITDLTGLKHAINLKVLNLYSNLVSDLSALAGLTRLASLDLGGTSVSDISALGGLTQLTDLHLGDNAISDISALGGLTQLTWLNLGGTSVSDMSALAGLVNLKRLYLYYNSISDISALGGLTQLTSLELRGNAISDLSALAGLVNLKRLYLYYNSISDISALGGLTQLIDLALGGNAISDVSTLGGLTQLTDLHLRDNAISDISALGGLTQLTRLRLGYNSISDVSPLLGLNLTGTDWDSAGLNLQGNPLSYVSINTHIPAMQAKGIEVEFDNQAHPALLKISGDNQSGAAFAPLSRPFIVEAQDENGSALAGISVTFAVTAGGGTLSTTITRTDANGRAQSTLTLGPNMGTNTVEVSADGIPSQITFYAICDTESPPMTADVNGDDVVNLLDLVFVGYILENGIPDLQADVDGDGVVSIADLVLVASSFGEGAAAPSAHPQIPETLTAVEVQGWLTEARGLEVRAPIMKRGFLVLEQLLVSLTPTETELLANYPNPFNPETWIPYHLAEDAVVTLTIYDATGQVVRTLDVGHRIAAAYESQSKAIHWAGRNDVGESVASGIYFYTLTAGDYSATRKMLILK